IPYYNRWLNRFPTIRSLAAATESEVLRAWEGLGYYARARNLHRCANTIFGKLGGKFPNGPDALRSYPESAGTPQTPSQFSRSTDPFPSSKPTPLALSPAFSIFARQLILPMVGKNCGNFRQSSFPKTGRAISKTR